MLVWLSITARPEGSAVEKAVEEILEAAECVGASLMVGGQHALSVQLPDHPRLLLGDSMVELAAFATGLSQKTAR